MQTLNFSSRFDVETHAAEMIGEESTDHAAAEVAEEIIIEAHVRGLHYGEDWSSGVDDLTGDEANWLAMLYRADDGAGADAEATEITKSRHAACSRCEIKGIHVDTTSGEIIENGTVRHAISGFSTFLLVDDYGRLTCDDCA